MTRSSDSRSITDSLGDFKQVTSLLEASVPGQSCSALPTVCSASPASQMLMDTRGPWRTCRNADSVGL